MTDLPNETFSFPPEDMAREVLSPLVFRHLDWLRFESTKHNLTRVPEADWLARHVLDSLAPFFAGWEMGESFVDIGSGPGFPGMPLGLQFDRAKFTLVESKKKVAGLLEEFLIRNGIAHRGSVRGERIEDLGRCPEFRESADRVVTRALAPLPVLIEMGTPFLREGGELWCWKSNISELNASGAAMSELRCRASRILEYTLPGETDSRIILAIRKDGPTPEKFPRKAGIPRKRPIV